MARKNKDEDILGVAVSKKEEKEEQRKATDAAARYERTAKGMVSADDMKKAVEGRKTEQAWKFIGQYVNPIGIKNSHTAEINQYLEEGGLPGVYSSQRAARENTQAITDYYSKARDIRKQYENPIYMPSSAAKDLSADLEAQGLPGVFTSRTVYQPIENKAGEYYKRTVRDISNEMSRIDDRIAKQYDLQEELDDLRDQYDDTVEWEYLNNPKAGREEIYEKNHQIGERIKEILADIEYLEYGGFVDLDADRLQELNDLRSRYNEDLEWEYLNAPKADKIAQYKENHQIYERINEILADLDRHTLESDQTRSQP